MKVISVMSLSPIKIAAVEEAYPEYKIVGCTPPVTNNPNQPVGHQEIYTCAISRMDSSVKGPRISIESGIVEDQQGNFFDQAIVILSHNGKYTKVYSQRLKVDPGLYHLSVHVYGKILTVGDLYARIAHSNPTDPHKHICGRPRKDFLVDALKELRKLYDVL